MNIIQLQDSLKGMPDDAIIQHVQNPTGAIPTYLALSELERRKSMRDKYQADTAQEKTVADQIVAETMPQGIGALMPTGLEQGAMPPQAPEMSPDMMSQSGVGALPAPNVGQNYAGGGIVAFAEGDLVGGLKNIDPLTLLPEYYMPDRYEKEDPRFPTMFDDPLKIFSATGNAPIRPAVSPPGAGMYSEEFSKMTEAARPPKEIKKEEMAPPAPQVTKEEVDLAKKAEQKIVEKKPLTDREQAAWLALTELGFGMMAGQSQYALQNIGTAGQQAAKSYASSIKDISDREALAQAALLKANQSAIENKLNIDKAAADYVEKVYGKPSEIMDSETLQKRNTDYEAKKIGLMLETGLISERDYKTLIQSIQPSKTSSNGFRIVQ
jgi:hypothetical protein